MTCLTRSDPHKALIFPTCRLGMSLSIPSLHIFDHALKCYIIYSDPPLTAIMHLYHSAIRAMHDHMANLRRQLTIWCIQIKIIRLCQCFQRTSCITSRILRRLPADHHDCPICQAYRWIRHKQFLRKLHLIANTGTGFTCTKRVGERKTARFNLFYADTTVCTGKALTEINLTIPGNIYDQESIRQAHNTLDRVSQTLFNPLANDKTIY